MSQVLNRVKKEKNVTKAWISFGFNPNGMALLDVYLNLKVYNELGKG